MYCQALIVNHYELPVILNGLHRETAHAVHSAHSAHGELRELAFFAALKSHLLHHLLHNVNLLEKLIYIFDLCAAARRNSALTLCVNNRGLFTLFFGH